MAVTAASLAAALGIKVAENPPVDDPGLVEAGRLLTLAGALVDAYLRDPDNTRSCPVGVRDEAIIRTAGHARGRHNYGRIEGRIEAGGARMGTLQPAARSAVRQSGAAAFVGAVGKADRMTAPPGVLTGECGECGAVDRCYRDEHGAARCLACVHRRWSVSQP